MCVCVWEREKYKDMKINIRMMYTRVSVSTLCTLVLVTHNTSLSHTHTHTHTHTHSIPQEVNRDTPWAQNWTGLGKAGTVWIRPALLLSLRPRPEFCGVFPKLGTKYMWEPATYSQVCLPSVLWMIKSVFRFRLNVYTSTLYELIVSNLIVSAAI